MRIGVDVRSLLDRPLTGVGEYTQQLLTALAKDGHDETYVLFSNSFRGHSALPLWDARRVTSRSFRVPNKLLNLSLKLFDRPHLDALIGGVDCFFAPNLNFLPLSPNVPFVLTVHDLSFRHYRELFSFRRRLWHTLLAPERLFARADVIIAVSQATAEDLHRTYGVAKERIVTIHSGIAPFQVTPELKERVRARYRLPTDFLLSLSTLEPRKNLLALLDAYALLRSNHRYRGGLVIAGAPGWSRGAFHRALEQHPFRNDIIVLPYVAPEEKHALYALAQLFFYVSVYEGFGFPPLEAATQGTPVVTGHHSSLSEMMGNSALLVDVHNVNDIAQAAARLLADERLRTTLIAEGRRVAASFSWQRAAAETRQVFHTVTHRHEHRH